mgnify:CR=1 FL=1
METVKLISAEGFEFVVDKRAAMVANTIKSMLSSQGKCIATTTKAWGRIDARTFYLSLRACVALFATVLAIVSCCPCVVFLPIPRLPPAG